MIPFNVKEFMQSGAFICGSRQAAGKTNLAKQIVELLLKDGIVIHILDSSKAWNEFVLPIIKIPFDFKTINIDFAQSQVVDLSELTHGQRISVVNQVAKAVYDDHVRNGNTTPEALILEEAQTYVFNGCSRTKDTFDAIMDYLTIGGNFNLSFILITQFPALVDKSFVKATQQRYFGISSEKNDTSYIKGFIENEDSKRLKQQLGISGSAFITKFLQRGQFVYQNRGRVEVFTCQKYVPTRIEQKPYFTMSVSYGAQPL
jgi:hypothetical protein